MKYEAITIIVLINTSDLCFRTFIYQHIEKFKKKVSVSIILFILKEKALNNLKLIIGFIFNLGKTTFFFFFWGGGWIMGM